MQYTIIKKSDSRLMKSLSKLLFFNKSFMDMVTTIRSTIYVPDNWKEFSEKKKNGIIEHEKVHIQQSKKYGFIRFAVMYVLLPFPIFYAKYRVKFEAQAYGVSLYYMDRRKYRSNAEHYAGIICGPQYGWASLDKEHVKNLIIDEYNKFKASK
tara:strand:+ start:766 stop:1224 length:459 start_codon:yes stop_codon:yes gene_type:complete